MVHLLWLEMTVPMGRNCGLGFYLRRSA